MPHRPELEKPERWLFIGKTILDTKHDKAFDLEGTMPCHCAIEEAVSIWYDGCHEDTVPCDSLIFTTTLYQFEQTSSYIPFVIRQVIKDTHGVY